MAARSPMTLNATGAAEPEDGDEEEWTVVDDVDDGVLEGTGVVVVVVPEP
jgi:hypothetical protein